MPDHTFTVTVSVPDDHTAADDRDWWTDMIGESCAAWGAGTTFTFPNFGPRPLFVSASRDDDQTNYTLTVDSPDGTAVLGLIVRDDETGRLLTWDKDGQAHEVGTFMLPPTNATD